MSPEHELVRALDIYTTIAFRGLPITSWSIGGVYPFRFPLDH
jgi:hypothetical protein